jgi:DNA mismatch repair protein MutL
LETETSLISVKGFVCKPESARKRFGEQFFYVNNRFMKHPYFHKAVTEAYQKLLPPDAIPSYFIFMETDPASIDVNIHPSKTEIKFENEKPIWQILLASVREALGKFNIVPSIDFENEALVDIPVRSSSSRIPDMPTIKINPDFNPFDSEPPARSRHAFFDRFEKEKSQNWSKLFAPLKEERAVDIADEERKIFQIKGKYIACPVISGVMLIDQKRAHERILYEKYLNSLSSNQFVSQVDMFPVALELNPSDMMVVKQIEPELSVLGFKIDFPDANIVILTGQPAGNEAIDPAELFKTFANEYRSADIASEMKEKIAAAMASASAIQYGKRLSQREMENLFDSLFACKEPNYSAKGKPVITILTIDEIDSRFK